MMQDDRIQCMIDLETFSLANNAMIISIGAVKFELWGTTVLDRFHVGIDPAMLHQTLRDKFHLDPKTLSWWMSKDQSEARDAWNELEKVDLGTALEGFSEWLGPDVPVWGNGAVFDNVVLANAYKTLGLEKPWSYKDDRCYRTIKSLMPTIAPLAPDGLLGVAHDALYDAHYQAAHLQLMMKAGL